MRRGRPTKVSGDAKVPKPSPSPLRPIVGDPFTALDSSAGPAPDAALLDDVAARFPALDDFSILHEKRSKFAFDPVTELSKQPEQQLSQRVTNALADDAFAPHPNTSSSIPPPNKPKVVDSKPPAKDTSQKLTSPHSVSIEHQSLPKSNMVSTGTMTSPSPGSPSLRPQSISSQPIFQIPSSSLKPRSLSQPRDYDTTEIIPSLSTIETAARPGLSNHRSKSHTMTVDAPKSSRTSFDLNHRKSYLSGLDDSVHRSKSANSKSRPPSLQASTKPKILRRLSRERPHVDESSQEARLLMSTTTEISDFGEEALKIDSNVEYLKRMEVEDTSKRKEKRLSGGSRHVKRASMPSVSLSGTKQLLAGRFGEAFRKFEINNGPERRESSRSPLRGPSDLTPIAGSEATDGRSDDGNVLEESEEAPPEVRRELERRRLSQEEKRVADAAAVYRQRVAVGGDTKSRPSSKAASIQSKVRSLLDESGRGSPSPTKTASGYGRFTDQRSAPDVQVQRKVEDIPPRTSSRQAAIVPSPNASISQYPPRVTSKPNAGPSKPSPFTPTHHPNTISGNGVNNGVPRQRAPSLEVRRPTGPPKPQPKPYALRTCDRPSPSLAKPSSLAVQKPAKQLQQPSQPSVTYVDGVQDDDWESSFSKRYPDLSGLKMVETEIDHPTADPGAPNRVSSLGLEMRVRDV